MIQSGEDLASQLPDIAAANPVDPAMNNELPPVMNQRIFNASKDSLSRAMF